MMALKKFSIAVQEWVELIEIDATDAVIKIGLDVYTGVLLRTRVDTGRLRGSWRIGLNQMDASNAQGDELGDSAASEGSAATGQEEAYALGVLGAVSLGDSIHISNSLPYAQYVNDTDDIIGETIRELLANLDAAIEEVRTA